MCLSVHLHCSLSTKYVYTWYISQLHILYIYSSWPISNMLGSGILYWHERQNHKIRLPVSHRTITYTTRNSQHKQLKAHRKVIVYMSCKCKSLDFPIKKKISLCAVVTCMWYDNVGHVSLICLGPELHTCGWVSLVVSLPQSCLSLLVMSAGSLPLSHYPGEMR